MSEKESKLKQITINEGDWIPGSQKPEEFQKKKYPKELVSKTITILQNLEQFGTVWNITFVMHSFRTLNMKINPESGEILHHNLESLMDFVKE